MDSSETSDDLQPPLQALLMQALNQMADGVMLTDSDGRIAWVNEAFCRFSGYLSDELVGRTPSILKSGEQESPFYAHLWQTIRVGKVWQGKVIDRRKDGTLYTVEECITPLRGANGAVAHYVAVQHDATEQQRLFEREHFLARHDTLTGLPNRALLHETAHQAVAAASRTRDLVTFIYLDLDGFKKVNDQFGHRVGDQLLSAVADRLRRTVRESDLVARVGGDEFVAVAPNLANRAAADRPADRCEKSVVGAAIPIHQRARAVAASARFIQAGVARRPTSARMARS